MREGNREKLEKGFGLVGEVMARVEGLVEERRREGEPGYFNLKEKLVREWKRERQEEKEMEMEREIEEKDIYMEIDE